jgi:hypothetical protein
MFALKSDGTIEQMKDGGGFASRRFLLRLVPAVHAGFEKVGPELCKAGTDSKQFAELTSCSPGGSDSPKLRTASAGSGGTYFDRS